MNIAILNIAYLIFKNDCSSLKDLPNFVEFNEEVVNSNVNQDQSNLIWFIFDILFWIFSKNLKKNKGSLSVNESSDPFEYDSEYETDSSELFYGSCPSTEISDDDNDGDLCMI